MTRKKIIISIASFVVVSGLVFFFLPGILNLFATDDPPVQDSDLLLSPLEIPKEDNAYFDLVTMSKALNISKDDAVRLQNHLDGKEWDDAFVNALLAKNETIPSQLATVLEKKYLQNPSAENPLTMDISSGEVTETNPRAIARLNALLALRFAKEQKWNAAIDQGIQSLQLSEKILSSRTGLIDYLQGQAARGIGLSNVLRMAKNKSIPNEVLTSLLQQLEMIDNPTQALKTAFRIEYIVSKNEYQKIEVRSHTLTVLEFLQGNTNGFYFQRNTTLQSKANYSRQELRNSEMWCGDIISPPLNETKYQITIQDIFTRDAYGQLIRDIEAVALRGLHQKRCEYGFQLAATKLIIALKLYQIDNQTIPTSLQSLVPNYIKSIPLDPFDGQPIRYSPTKRIVYSIGNDGIDNGGSEGDDWRKMPDPTFTID